MYLDRETTWLLLGPRTQQEYLAEVRWLAGLQQLLQAQPDAAGPWPPPGRPYVNHARRHLT